MITVRGVWKLLLQLQEVISSYFLLFSEISETAAVQMTKPVPLLREVDPSQPQNVRASGIRKARKDDAREILM